MPSSIGLRFYEVTVIRRADSAAVRLNDPQLVKQVPAFIADFVSHNASVTLRHEIERSWYLEEREAENTGISRGIVHYGTYGFESNFVDSRTKQTNYRRQIHDVEEIPLFYEFWCPPESDFGLLAFQSFQIRSCVTVVTQALRDHFQLSNPAYYLRVRKLMPADVKGSAYYRSPVKRIRLIKRRAPKDVTDRYFTRQGDGGADFEIAIAARRNGTLGPLAAVGDKIKPQAGGVLRYDGIEFDEALAEVMIGGRRRRVGVFGLSADTGVIDVSDAVEKGPDGHPVFSSMKTEVRELMDDFHKVLSR
jgi:hypothetical protein